MSSYFTLYAPVNAPLNLKYCRVITETKLLVQILKKIIHCYLIEYGVFIKTVALPTTDNNHKAKSLNRMDT